MKKTVIFVLIGVLAVSLAGAVAFAAPGIDPGQPGAFCPAWGSNNDRQATLTDEQKTQMETWHKARVEQRKQELQKQVEWGWLTQAQADQKISWLEQHHSGNDGMGPGRGMMGHGHGMGAMTDGCSYNAAPAQ